MDEDVSQEKPAEAPASEATQAAAYKFSRQQIAQLQDGLSGPRLRPYLAEAGNIDDALRLYLWNCALASTFHSPLAMVEIMLRNALDAQLVKIFRQRDWFSNQDFTDMADEVAKRPPSGANHVWPNLLDQINKAQEAAIKALQRRIEEAQRAGRRQPEAQRPTVDDIVAQLTYGFWTTIMSRHFQASVWNKGLYGAFPHFMAVEEQKIKRERVAEVFTSLRRVRNRIAHHEPLLNMRISETYGEIIRSASWMHGDVAEIIHNFSRCTEIEAQRGNAAWF
jgi:hypothetical protein